MSGFAASLFWALLFIGGGIFLAYQRVDLRTSTIAAGAALVAYTVFGSGSWLWLILLWALFAIMVVPNLVEVRREKITKPLLAVYRKMLPSMSSTEREALEAGSVWWDGELFSGMPEWDKLMSFPAPQLSEEEQAFVDGPCEELCRMIDDWAINHEIGDLPIELQAKLLRILQDHEFERLGSSVTKTVDTRVIAATNRDLDLLIEQGAFRADLYYRLLN